MATWAVVDRITGKTIHAYTSEDPEEWVDMPFSVFNHIKETPVIPKDVSYCITVGSFFDRFKDQKIAVLSSDNPFIQACITDSLSRKYIDLKGRYQELNYLLNIIVSLGYSLDVDNILGATPTEEELWLP